jgi:hypothetical protein
MHKNKIKEKCKIPDMRKLSDNFYLLIRKEKTWNKDEIKLIRKYLNYKIFYPIPKSFIDVAIFGYHCEFGFYQRNCPKYILFNFDSKNGKKLSLRGMSVVSNDGLEIVKGKSKRYFKIELIGNKPITNPIVKSMKAKNNIVVQSGKDMLLFWKEFGKRSYFDYCKLNAMEDVIGFYWKYGWRFGSSNFDYFKKKENIVAKYIEKLNDINKKYKITKKMYLLYERDELLSKYFDKYMDDYYSDRKMIDYKLYNKDIKDYLLKNTLHLQRFNLRFDGYPMYLDCR